MSASARGPELVVLGAGSILPRAGYGSSGYALELEPGGPLTLFDCGPGTLRALGAVGFEDGLERLERVVLSHFHLDHCLDVFALAFARHNKALRRVPPLELCGPVGLAALVEGGAAALGRFARDPDGTVREVVLDDDGRGGFDCAYGRFTCVRTGHNREALAWRLDLTDGTSLAYTGDTGPNPAVAELARGVDLFVCECSFPDEAATANHLTPRTAGELARQGDVGRLVLTHFYPGLSPADAAAGAARTYDGPIESAHDGSRHLLRP